MNTYNKHLFAAVLAILWIAHQATLEIASAQGEAPPAECGFVGTGSTTATQLGGQWMTARDTLHVLIVFVQFPDDRYDTTYSLWPTHPSAGSYPGPTFANTYIDSSPAQMSSNGNLTHYFRDMSFGAFMLTGKTRFVVTPHSRQWYLDNGWCRWLINKEVLESLDAELDFSEFDRWKRYAEYDIRREADGRVDDIVMLYRNVANEYPRTPIDSVRIIMQDRLAFYGGESSLGYSFDCGGPSEFFVDGGQRRIASGHPAYSGVGMGTTSVIAGAGDGWYGLVPYRVQIHELSHHWMSNGPEYGHNGAGFWAMLNDFRFRCNAASTSCPNSFERELVGWHYPDSIGTTGGTWDNLTLSDYVTQNESYKIKVPGNNPNEFFRLENHQRISPWDTPEMLDAAAKGLYIIHQTSITQPKYDLRLEPADGRWSWSTPEVGYVSWYPAPLPVYRKTGIERVNGYNDSWEVPFTLSIPPYTAGAMEVILWRDRATNAIIEKPLIRGDGNDAFTLEKDKVFSPWSNPNSQNQAKQKTWIAIEIVNEVNGAIVFNLHIDSANCLLSSPSKPQALEGSYLTFDNPPPSYSYALLTWAPMLEPDVISSGKVLIHRRSKVLSSTWSSWSLIDSVAGSDSVYVDWSMQSLDPGNPTDSVQYRIQARDNSGKLSVYSDVITILIDPRRIDKRTVQDNAKPVEYALNQNYPNPFNPTTTIKYQLAEDGIVELRIFDILGREVTELVKQFQPAGYYSAIFNADELASGIYFVRFTVNNQMGRPVFTKISKMALVR